MERENEEGTVALPIDSLVAVAGGVVGGVLTASTLWLVLWKVIERRTRRDARQC